MFLDFFGNKDYVAIFMNVINISGKLAHCYYTEKWQLSTVLTKVICCYNYVKCEANSPFFLFLLEIIRALNLLKRFPPRFNYILPYLVKLVTFDVIPILLIY